MRIEDIKAEEWKMKRNDMRRYLVHLLQLAHAQGNHTAQRALEVGLAALDYGDSNHTGDSNCSAGDCDACTAKDALAKLEELIGGPRGPWSAS